MSTQSEMVRDAARLQSLSDLSPVGDASEELLTRLAASYPVPRLGTSLEVADLICFAASEEAGYITGASFDINGGDLMM